MADIKYKRYEKSLGLLTTRFVSLIQKAKDGVLDLKVVSIICLFDLSNHLWLEKNNALKPKHAWDIQISFWNNVLQ